jgi:hypothetical protein
MGGGGGGGSGFGLGAGPNEGAVLAVADGDVLVDPGPLAGGGDVFPLPLWVVDADGWT